MEVCQADPQPPQRGDFFRAVEAGAAIVSGSQAHCPQKFEFIGDTFVHFGLGNLFFDQMDKIERMAFIDRYYFYDNHLLGVDPIGIIRTDEAQPNLMTGEPLKLFIENYYAGNTQQ
jgi:poly-gamma-glutamate capsule biosynthesis protein CapA/YwtB (metallophosphatase superfamily)